MDLQVRMSKARRGEIAFALLKHITQREGALVKMEAFVQKLLTETDEIGISLDEAALFAFEILTPLDDHEAVTHDQTYSRRHPDNDRRKA